ncbi:MAG: 4-(cytidine 5'-diphospho)-2-C-methyl-D-erythritol kinase [Bacteroidales bacterium]
MILFSNAKINIGLLILGKRADGFHDISTALIPIPLNDIIELNLADKSEEEFSMEQSGIIIPGKLEDNLCYKSWNLFSKAAGEIKVKMHLHKCIPVGAGLGGGSSNAVAVLIGLNKLTGNKLSRHDIHHIATQLGSDCTFFIENKPALAEGRGEILSNSPVSLEGFHMLLLNPGISINTAWAYKKVNPNKKREPLHTLLSKPIQTWKTTVSNDFESIVFKAYPEVASLKAELYMAGAIFTSMSGSGSTVYGLFEEEPDLDPGLKKHLLWQGRL